MAKFIQQASTFLLAFCLATPSLLASVAAEEVYLDNRSDPASLMVSYYNALNRSEYARAWSYWHEHVDAGSYGAFFEGVVDRKWTDLSVGDIVSEGAAGSLYYTMPVTVTQIGGADDQSVLLGCVVMRLVQPAIQEPPFTPLHIESLDLAETKLDPATALADACH